MTVQLATHNAISLSSLSTDKKELLKRTICKGATDDELELFTHACNRTKLDPFMRQIYAVKRWQDGKEVMTIQTGIDGYRLIADRTGKYMPGKDCTFTYKDGKVFSATAYVKKKDDQGNWHEISHTAYWDEYAAKKKDGSLMTMWRDKPHIMLGKCAEAAALRKAFPADLSGIYTKEELEHVDVDVIDSTPSETKIKPIVQAECIANEETITSQEAQEIEFLLLEEPKEYREDLLKYFSHARKLAAPMVNFYGLPRRFYNGCLKSIQKRKEEKQKRPIDETTEDNNEQLSS